MVSKLFLEWLESKYSEFVFLNESMKNHTSFKIGGAADVLIKPQNEEMIIDILKKIKEYNVPLTVMGNGSNLIVLDSGVRGVIIKIGNCFNKLQCEDNVLKVGAGVSLAKVANFAKDNNLTGLEFAVGIPGSLGGAVFMNAGAYDGEMSKIIDGVSVIDLDGNKHFYTKEDLFFDYRFCNIQTIDCIIVDVVISLQKGEQAMIIDKMNCFTTRRNSKQPLEYPSAGSVFKRPVGNYAGTLIDKAGLKGFKIGGAEVSTKHAGFIINSGDASAKNVLDLIEHVKEVVYKKNNIKLETEVRVIGEKSCV
jgi:UDP-N-acetylmuramate dehydrogenase